MKIKLKCQSCQRIYLGGRAGFCEWCLTGKVRAKKVKPAHCQCGKIAIEVMLATVLTPEDEFSELEIPLCRHCLELELEDEPRLVGKPVPTDPSLIVVVKSLPRAKPPLKGRKI